MQRTTRTALLFPGVLLSAACNPTDTEREPPGELMAGIAETRMPAPVGIGTVGYGGFGVVADPSPFSDIYPATTGVHGHPTFRAVVLSRGEGYEVVWLRTDTVGVFQQFRRAIVLEVRQRTGRDLDDFLIAGATHTHSGPGRVIDGGGLYDLIADSFFPEFYGRMVDAAADAIEAAYADLKPARVGVARAVAAEGHGDRRCEDGEDHQNDEMPLVVVEREDRIEAIVSSYAVHGTILDIDQLTLSRDSHGGIEEAIEDRFDHPVLSLSFNSWGADMSPANPEIDLGTGSPMPDGFLQMERIGYSVADDVETALADVVWMEDPVLSLETHRVVTNRESLGYQDGEFEYEYGGVYCGSTLEPDCENVTIYETLDEMCIAFPEEWPAPVQTEITVGRVGDLYVVTFPGEPGTRLAEAVMEGMRRNDGVERVAFYGYAQDYNGYSILEDDWWHGGYEASGALWGPLQGEYLKDAAIRFFDGWLRGEWMEDGFEPWPTPAFEEGEYEPYVPTPPVGLGTVRSDVAASYTPMDVVTITVQGGDPWLGTPIARLETPSGDPVLRANGVPVTSDGYAFWIGLATEPTYEDEMTPAQRTFLWTFHLPASRAVPDRLDLSGSYRISVELPDGDGDPTVVTSGTFEIAP